MKINYKNKDLKLVNWGHGYSCVSCAFNPTPGLLYCRLLCHSSKIWRENISNSDIFKL